MRNGIKCIAADLKLFIKKSCYTTLIAVAVYFIIWGFPTIQNLLKPWINIPGELLFVILAVLVLAILADQVNKRHRMPDRVAKDVARHTK